MGTSSQHHTGPLDGPSHLREHGGIALRGGMSEPFRRWRGKRRGALVAALVIAGLGVVVAAAGATLRAVGAWAALIPLGALLVFVGLTMAGLLALVAGTHRFRLVAESQPVVLDQHGIRLRGIGPIPWGHVGPPEYRRIFTKNDVSGRCAVMPLTAQGHATVNEHFAPWALLVGPKPYLRPDVPYLLLPGVEGLAEDEVVRLFATAYDMFGGQPGAASDA